MASPSITAPSELTFASASLNALSGQNAIVIADDDAVDSNYTVTLTIGLGQFLDFNLGGATGSYNSAGNSLTIAGSLAALNVALQNLYVNNATQGQTALSVDVVADTGASVARQIAVTVPASLATIPPAITAPATIVAPDGQAIGLPAVSVSDPDALQGQGIETVTISASAGDVLVNGAGSDGVTYISGGSGTSGVVLEGSVAKVNAELATLAYVGNSSNATITIDAQNFAGSAPSESQIAVTGIPGSSGATATFAVADGAFDDPQSWTPSGVPGTQDIVVFSAGTHVVSGPGAAGQIDVTGTVAATGALLAVGRSGTGVDIDNGGSLTLAGDAALTVDDTTDVGANGNGTLTLSGNTALDPAGLSTTTVILGATAGSSGTMLVGAARWSDSSTVVVGEAGAGVLTINDESAVRIGDVNTTDGLLEVAADAGSTGLVSIDESGARFTVNGDVVVGGTIAGPGGHGTLLQDTDTTIAGVLTVQNDALVQVHNDLTAGAIDVAAGGVLIGDGQIDVATTNAVVTNDGTIEALAAGLGNTFQINGAVTGTGTLKIDDDAGLGLSQSVSAGQTIAFGIGSTLSLDSATASAMNATLFGFGAGDSIAFTSDPYALSSVAYDPSTHKATVTDANGGTFSLVFAGTHAASDFAIVGGKIALVAQPVGIAAPASLKSVEALTTPLGVTGLTDLTANVFMSTAVVTATYGTFATTAGLSGTSTVSGSGTQQITINDYGFELAADLAALTYTAPSVASDPSGTDNITIAVADDQGGSGQASIPVAITPLALTHHWNNASGGAFASGANWSDGAAPGTGDVAAFGAGFYTVSGGGTAGQVTVSGSTTATFTGAIVASDQSGLTTYDNAVDIDTGARAIFAVGGSLDAAATVIAGDAGAGTLQLAGGTAAISAGNLIVGDQAGSDGAFGADSTASVAGDVVVGAAGTGALNLDGSSALLSDTDGIVGQSAGSVGTATIGGGVWSSSATFDVGLAGSGYVRADPFTIGDGGPQASIVDSDGVVGAMAQSTGTVVLTQVVWTNANSLTIGEAGSGDVQLTNGAAVTVFDGSMSAGAVAVAAQTGSTGSLEISGGSTFASDGDIAIGGTDTAAGGKGSVTVGEYTGDSGILGTTGTLTIWNTGTLTLTNGLTLPGVATSTGVMVEAATLDIVAGGILSGDGSVVGAPTSGTIQGPNSIPSGSFALSSVDNEGTIAATGGRLLLYGNVTGSGMVTIAAGAELDVQGTGAASQTIAFEGGGAELALDSVGGFASTITGFAPGDTLYIPGVAETRALWSNDVLTVSGGTTSSSLNLTGDYSDDVFTTTPDGAGGTMISIACYCRGTSIATSDGDMAVENLAIGDRLVTVAGDLRPIKWIGTRSYAGRFANANAHVLPICFKMGSLGVNIPHRDLWVSPKHAMFLDGVLIPAEHLVNGVSITQARRVDRVDYFHIELDSHDVIVAEGAASETFIDDDSRAMFHNATTYAALYPGAASPGALYYAPRLEDGFALEDVRRRLSHRAATVSARIAA